MKPLTSFVASSVLLVSGCATQPFLGGPGAPDGIAMKAEQRGILATTRKLRNGDGAEGSVKVVCPEASPDAIAATSLGTAFGQALNASSGGATTDKQLNAALSIAQSVASIGLRTQSIQLMRDGMVYSCVLLMNGLSVDNAYKLQRRSQNFTLGLLAIEQLTGAVKAQQASISSGGGGGSGQSDVTKEAADLTAAQDRMLGAQSAHTTAQNDLVDLKAAERDLGEEADNLKKKRDTAVAKAVGTAGESQEQKDAKTATDEFDEADTKAKAKSKEVLLKTQEVEHLGTKKVFAEQNEKLMQQQLDLARSRVHAYTNAAAVIAASGGVNISISDNVAERVENIVKLVLFESGLGEECNAATVSMLTAPEDSVDRAYWYKRYQEVCSREQKQEQEKNQTVKSTVENAEETLRILKVR